MHENERRHGHRRKALEREQAGLHVSPLSRLISELRFRPAMLPVGLRSTGQCFMQLPCV